MEYSSLMARAIGAGSEPVYAFPEFRESGPRMIAAIVAAAIYPGQAKSEIKKSGVTRARKSGESSGTYPANMY